MDTKDDFYLPEDILEWIGLKKSEYLSRLINELSSDDYGFEDFHKFDEYLQETIGRPDETYEDKSEQFPIRTCIKTFSGFHQIAIGAVIPDMNSEAQVFVPVLTFVTKKQQVVLSFSQGDSKKKHTLN